MPGGNIEANGHLKKIANARLATARYIGRPFAEGRHKMVNPFVPIGNGLIRPALPSNPYKIIRVEEVPASGSVANPGDLISLVPSIRQDGLLLPCMGISYTLDDTAPQSLDNGGFPQGSWFPFKNQRTYVGEQLIEDFQDTNIFRSYDVGINRRDSYSFTGFFSEKTPFRSIKNLNSVLDIRDFNNSVFRKFYNDGQPARYYEMVNPITRSKQVFPGSWYNVKTRFELDCALNEEVAWSSTGVFLPKFQLKNLKFIYYFVTGYSETTKQRYINRGFILPMRHISETVFFFDSSFDPLDETIIDDTACLSELVIIPLRRSVKTSSQVREKLTYYVPSDIDNFDHLQLEISGVLYPQNPLSFRNEDEAAQWEYAVRWGHVGSQRRVDEYDGNILPISEFAVPSFAFGANAWQWGDIADGIDLSGGRRAIHINKHKTVGTTNLDFHVYLKKVGCLYMEKDSVDFIN